MFGTRSFVHRFAISRRLLRRRRTESSQWPIPASHQQRQLRLRRDAGHSKCPSERRISSAIRCRAVISIPDPVVLIKLMPESVTITVTDFKLPLPATPSTRSCGPLLPMSLESETMLDQQPGRTKLRYNYPEKMKNQLPNPVGGSIWLLKAKPWSYCGNWQSGTDTQSIIIWKWV